jgi:dienelactone hydrolase
MNVHRLTRAFYAAWIALTPAACLARDLPVAPSYAEHQDLSYYLDAKGIKRSIESIDDWKIRRQHVLAHLQTVMGPLPKPESPVPLECEYGEPVSLAHSMRCSVSYHTDSPTDRVRAWLFIPSGGPKAMRRPAVLCLHQTTPIGKDEPAGLGSNPNLDYALELADRGYVTIAPDYPSFGEHEYDFDRSCYESGSMKAIYDNMRAIDLLTSLPEVDPERIACIGHSLGGHNSIFTAVFDARLKAIVSCCGFTRFHKYKGGDLTGWSSSRYMPRIAADYNADPDRVPFDFPELTAALAPRAFLAVAPLADDNFDVAGVRDVFAAARPIYELYGEADRLVADYPNAAHDFPMASRQRAYEFIDKHLNHQPLDHQSSKP